MYSDRGDQGTYNKRSRRIIKVFETPCDKSTGIPVLESVANGLKPRLLKPLPS